MADKLKNRFFTTDSVNALSSTLRHYYPKFDAAAFIASVFSEPWDQLELKDRMRHVTRCMYKFLPGDYVTALVILLKAAPEVKGFEGMTLPDYVEHYGMDHLEESLNALGEFTRYSSSEFAIRPFLDKHPGLTMHYMKVWAGSKHATVRRFASEGCRPRLPWAMVLPNFILDPHPVLEVLEQLRDDPSLFVRKSVANNLNDISKDNPDLALETAIRWYGHSDRTNWIVKHGLRTLLKQGNTRVLRLFNFGDPANIEINALKVQPAQLSIGDSVVIEFEINNKEADSRKIRMEYRIEFVKASGKTSPKVFQVVEKEFAPGTSTLRRKHSFANLTTRKHYPGRHKLSLLVNGVDKALVWIDLKA